MILHTRKLMIRYVNSCLYVQVSIGVTVCLSVCLSAPNQDFDQNRLVCGLYLLHSMIQK